MKKGLRVILILIGLTADLIAISSLAYKFTIDAPLPFIQTDWISPFHLHVVFWVANVYLWMIAFHFLGHEHGYFVFSLTIPLIAVYLIYNWAEPSGSVWWNILVIVGSIIIALFFAFIGLLFAPKRMPTIQDIHYQRRWNQ